MDNTSMAFSLKHLLLVILVIAVGLTGLLNPHRDVFQNLMGIVTIAILIYFAYSIWVTKGEARAFCIGFVLWSALYFVEYTRNFLGIDWGLYDALNVLYVKLDLEAAIGNDTDHPVARSRFFYVGRCLIALILGLIGGWVTVCFYRKREKMLRSSASNEPRSGDSA